MFPTLLDLGPLHVRAYGALLALTFILGITLSARRAGRAGLDPEAILGLAWIMVVAGVAGARGLFVLQHASRFAERPLDVFKVWEGGLTLYGGLIAATLCTIWYLMRKTDRPWAYTDVMAPFVMLGEGLTRLGCFLNGCCFGRVCDLPWGVTFPEESFASDALGHPHVVHPSQVYQSIAGFVGFFFLSWLWKRARFDGQVFWALVIVEGALRFLTDFARYYEPDQLIHLGGLTFSDSQLMAAGFVLIGAIGMGIRRQRAAALSA